ncbi:MAG TPA: helix-turn-helix domain-containing protein [Terracidiphilus sp.]|jgi:transcriptional regulator with XRE-family HTH domain
MNFSQMHERLRLELLRRIQRGTLSVSLLSRQTGFGQAHLSNFLHSRRQLSLQGLDRIMAALQLSAEDLIPAAREERGGDEDLLNVPLVSHATAMFEPLVRPGAVQRLLQVPSGVLERTRARTSASRHTWLRFVAVQIERADAMAMDPVILPEAVVLLDRHYNSFQQYRPVRPNLYAVRHGAELKLRYAGFQKGRLVLRPHSRLAPVELIDPEPGETPTDLITGRVVMVMNEL